MEMSSGSNLRDTSASSMQQQQQQQQQEEEDMNNNLFSGELQLPPGFRFHPTDEELVVHYLTRKLASHSFRPMPIVMEVDLYKFDPWELPQQAAFGEKEWYFFSPRDRKYPNGVRPNRAAASGYWKATGTDKIIHSSSDGRKIGVKKALVFYKGRAPKGIKSNWIMHEYRLVDSNHKALTARKKGSLRLDDWVLCRIYKKKAKAYSRTGSKVEMRRNMLGGTMMEEDILASLPELDEQQQQQQNRMMQVPPSSSTCNDPFVQALLGNQQLRSSLPVNSFVPMELQLLRSRQQQVSESMLFPSQASGGMVKDHGLWQMGNFKDGHQQQQQQSNCAPGLGLLESLQRQGVHNIQQDFQQHLAMQHGEVVDDTFQTGSRNASLLLNSTQLEFNNSFNLHPGTY